MVNFLYGTLLDNLICQIHMISVKLNKAKSVSHMHENTKGYNEVCTIYILFHENY